MLVHFIYSLKILYLKGLVLITSETLNNPKLLGICECMGPLRNLSSYFLYAKIYHSGYYFRF